MRLTIRRAGTSAAREQADDAVGIADRRDLGRRDHDRLVGAGDRVLEALLDAGRAVDEHEVVLSS